MKPWKSLFTLYLLSINLLFFKRLNPQNMSTVVSKADCCLDSCCVECDPDLPDIETPFWGSVHEMPNTLTEEGKFYRKGFARIPENSARNSHESLIFAKFLPRK